MKALLFTALCDLQESQPKQQQRLPALAELSHGVEQTRGLVPESHRLGSLDIDALYESIVRQIAGDAIVAPQGESLKEAVEYTQQREKLEKQIVPLKAKMKKEKQLGRQMELRREIIRLEEMAL